VRIRSSVGYETAELPEKAERMNKGEYPETDLTEKIIAAAIEVHRILGPGFGEDVYEEAFAYELKLRGIPYSRQVEHSVSYKDITAKTYRNVQMMRDGIK